MVHIESETGTSSAAVGTQPQVADPTGYIADPGPLGLAGFRHDDLRAQCFQRRIGHDLRTGRGGPAAGAVLRRFGPVRGRCCGNSGRATRSARLRSAHSARSGCRLPPTPSTWSRVLAVTRTSRPASTCWAGRSSPATCRIAAARVNGAVLGVFVFLTLTFVALTIGIWSQTSAITKLGGWLGLITAALAWYASCAGVANATWKRTLLPVFPLAPAQH